MKHNVTALIVTYNRKDLLRRCLQAIYSQTLRPQHILVVDNASSDGTPQMLMDEFGESFPELELLRLSENTGGSGGFSAGIAHSVGSGSAWIWLMDDDAIPHLDALERLMSRVANPDDLYGSVAMCGDGLSWPMQLQDGGPKRTIHTSEQLAATQDVQFIPFLGLLVSAAIVSKIGIPDAGFFIAADDVDYCLRARSHGAKIILVGDSRIEHPASERYLLWLPARPFYSLRLTPWKRYYDVRNRLFVARNHYGMGLYYSTIPGSFLRLAATLWHESNRTMQLRAFIGGMIDGLTGKKGRRHEVWGLRP